MILSFHPCYEGEENRLCAGRDPGSEEIAAIRRARAVILPQGCRESLYRIAKAHCPHVFPDYDARFAFLGKTGQIRLFRALGMPHPRSVTFSDAADFFKKFGTPLMSPPFSFPLIVKRDHGGEGEGVFLADTADALKDRVIRENSAGGSGQRPFLIQEFVPAGNRCLRVTVIGDTLYSYWRIQPDPGRFLTNLTAGGAIDAETHPTLQRVGREAVRELCRKTGINLAGIDILFVPKEGKMEPLFLEINYFFGRRGLGGSKRYYQMLTQEIDRWLSDLKLKRQG